MARGSSWRVAAAGLLVLCAAVLAPPAAALDIGIQSAGDGVSKQQACSRTCESDHCTTAPFLRYGKYCGILYSGCPGEAPCDALDACCMHHDNCVQAKTCVCRGLPEHGLQRGPAGLPGEAAGGHVHVRGEQVHDRRGHRRDLARHRGRRRRRQGAAQAVARRPQPHAAGVEHSSSFACLRGRWVVHLLRACLV
ncbi:unnamed protein product [Urochloa decumbens]|uniref:Phospholipase A2 n=1 Tax=Urochloa decumbens TaxID=240449 RepID=A0ABC8YJZ0_9POAL